MIFIHDLLVKTTSLNKNPILVSNTKLQIAQALYNNMNYEKACEQVAALDAFIKSDPDYQEAKLQEPVEN